MQINGYFFIVPFIMFQVGNLKLNLRATLKYIL